MNAKIETQDARTSGKSPYDAGIEWAATATPKQREAMQQCRRECDAQAHRHLPSYTFGCIEDAVIDPPEAGGYNSSAAKAFCQMWFGSLNPAFSDIVQFMDGAIAAIRANERYQAEETLCTFAGREWASKATHRQLTAMKTLAEFVNSPDWTATIPSAYGEGRTSADVVFGEGWGRSELERFCEEWLGTSYPTKEQVAWFILSAASVE